MPKPAAGTIAVRGTEMGEVAIGQTISLMVVATVGKAALREQLLAARRSVSDHIRAEQASALVAHVAGLAIDGGTVCAYVPVGAEPGSVELLDVLMGRADRVLLPVARTTADGNPAGAAVG